MRGHLPPLRSDDQQEERGDENAEVKEGFWPFVDNYGSDDAGMLWWDPSAVGEDEVHQVGNGLYRYAGGAKRYTRGKFPAKGQGGLFDTASSVTIFSQLPPEDTQPTYPPPAAGG